MCLSIFFPMCVYHSITQHNISNISIDILLYDFFPMTHQQVDVDGFLWVTSSCAIKLQSLSPDTDDPPFFNRCLPESKIVAEKNIDAHDTYIEQNKEKQIKHNKRIKRSTEERNSKKKMKMKMKQRRRRLREQTRELRDRAFAQKLACKRNERHDAHHWLVKNTEEKSLEELYHEEDDLLDVCFICLLLVLLFVVLCMMVTILK